MDPIFEPFRIKSVEPLRLTTLDERLEILARADHNLFPGTSHETMPNRRLEDSVPDFPFNFFI